jgi:small subunit ribosomal protein S6
LRDYEILYIVRADLDDDKVQDIIKRVNTLIERAGGSLERTNVWGKRKLAYEVKKQLKGIYLFFSYLGQAGLLEEVERNLRLTDSVIRYYSVKIAENVDPAARPSEFTEEAFTKAATPGPDEEEIATGQASARSPFDEEEGAFDFEEAVFGGVDEPARRGGKKD